MARILQVCNTDFYLGKFLSPLLLELASRNHVVECVCEGHKVDPRLAAAGIAVHDFGFPRKGSLLEFIAAIRCMQLLLRRGNYDCVDSHNRNASIVTRGVAREGAREPVHCARVLFPRRPIRVAARVDSAARGGARPLYDLHAAERVNDFETPGCANLVSNDWGFSLWRCPVWVG